MTLFEQLTQPGTGPIVGAVITGLISIQTLFLKWLLSSFSNLREDLKFVTGSTQLWLKEHETKDQVRHEENLHRFETISVALAKIGSIRRK
jgi:hypothetical protein